MIIITLKEMITLQTNHYTPNKSNKSLDSQTDICNFMLNDRYMIII